jgi:hypothetical protein
VISFLSSQSVLRALATIWVVTGAFGLIEAAGGLFAGEGPYPNEWWAWNLALSAAMMVAGFGVLARREWAIWLAAPAVAVSLAVAVAFFASNAPGMPNPMIAATIFVHLLGLAALARWIHRDRVATDASNRW